MNRQDLMDAVNLLSFYIGIENLEENLTQNSASDLLEKAVGDIHEHLQKQDDKIDMILEVIKNDKNKNTG